MMNNEIQHFGTERNKEHSIKMSNRRLLDLTGVKEVDSFDNEEFLLQTTMGYLVIRGENLHMKNLDVEEGLVSIKGRIYEVAYLDNHQGEKTKGLFNKLFK